LQQPVLLGLRAAQKALKEPGRHGCSGGRLRGVEELVTRDPIDVIWFDGISEDRGLKEDNHEIHETHER